MLLGSFFLNRHRRIIFGRHRRTDRRAEREDMHVSQEHVINGMTSECCTYSSPPFSYHSHTHSHTHTLQQKGCLEPANYSVLYWTLAASEV